MNDNPDGNPLPDSPYYWNCGLPEHPVKRLPVEPCISCGRPMVAIAGSRLATCNYCGFKDPCC
jgi:hypothetical protein